VIVSIYVLQSYSSLDKVAQLQKAMELLKVTQAAAGGAGAAAPRSMEEAKRKQYAFWDTQPVPKIGEHLQQKTFKKK
jgi:hypothetical protein